MDFSLDPSDRSRFCSFGGCNKDTAAASAFGRSQIGYFADFQSWSWQKKKSGCLCSFADSFVPVFAHSSMNSPKEENTKTGQCLATVWSILAFVL